MGSGVGEAELPYWCFVAGTYRSASTTQYRMVRDVVEETDSGIGIGYHTEAKLKDYDDPSQGRFVVCKVFRFLPETSKHAARFLREGRIRSLVTVRDPRDVITSMKRRANSTWELPRVVKEELPIWLEDVTKWIDMGPEITLVTKFDDLISNLFREVNRIAAHLDIDIDKKLAHKIARRYTIRSQRIHAERVRETGERADPFLPSVPGIVFGTSGQWQTWLAPREARLIEDVARKFMLRWGYL